MTTCFLIRDTSSSKHDLDWVYSKMGVNPLFGNPGSVGANCVSPPHHLVVFDTYDKDFSHQNRSLDVAHTKIFYMRI